MEELIKKIRQAIEEAGLTAEVRTSERGAIVYAQSDCDQVFRVMTQITMKAPSPAQDDAAPYKSRRSNQLGV